MERVTFQVIARQKRKSSVMVYRVVAVCLPDLNIFGFKKREPGASEMAQWSGLLRALSEAVSLTAASPRQFTLICNSSSRGSSPLF